MTSPVLSIESPTKKTKNEVCGTCSLSMSGSDERQHLKELLSKAAMDQTISCEALLSHWPECSNAMIDDITPFCAACMRHYPTMMALLRHAVEKCSIETWMNSQNLHLTEVTHKEIFEAAIEAMMLMGKANHPMDVGRLDSVLGIFTCKCGLGKFTGMSPDKQEDQDIADNMKDVKDDRALCSLLVSNKLEPGFHSCLRCTQCGQLLRSVRSHIYQFMRNKTSRVAHLSWAIGKDLELSVDGNKTGERGCAYCSSCGMHFPDGVWAALEHLYDGGVKHKDLLLAVTDMISDLITGCLSPDEFISALHIEMVCPQGGLSKDFPSLPPSPYNPNIRMVGSGAPTPPVSQYRQRSSAPEYPPGAPATKKMKFDSSTHPYSRDSYYTPAPKQQQQVSQSQGSSKKPHKPPPPPGSVVQHPHFGEPIVVGPAECGGPAICFLCECGFRNVEELRAHLIFTLFNAKYVPGCGPLGQAHIDHLPSINGNLVCPACSKPLTSMTAFFNHCASMVLRTKSNETNMPEEEMAERVSTHQSLIDELISALVDTMGGSATVNQLAGFITELLTKTPPDPSKFSTSKARFEAQQMRGGAAGVPGGPAGGRGVPGGVGGGRGVPGGVGGGRGVPGLDRGGRGRGGSPRGGGGRGGAPRGGGGRGGDRGGGGRGSALRGRGGPPRGRGGGNFRGSGRGRGPSFY